MKCPKGYLYLTQVKRSQPVPDFLRGFDSLNPGKNGAEFCQKVTALVRAGMQDCFLFVEQQGLNPKTQQQLPFWLRQLKMEHPQLDFHIRCARMA